MQSIIKKMLVAVLALTTVTHITAHYVPAGEELTAASAGKACQKACRAKGKTYANSFVTPDTNETKWVQLSDANPEGFGDYCLCR